MIPGFSWTKVNTLHITRVSQQEGATVAEEKTSTTYKMVGEPKIVNGKSQITLDTALPIDASIPDGATLSNDRTIIS